MREVISEAGAVRDDAAPPFRAHCVCGVSTSVTFLRNWLISKVLEAATWRSNSVFASFYFKDISYVFEGLRSLGPFCLLRVMLLIPRNLDFGRVILGIFYSRFWDIFSLGLVVLALEPHRWGATWVSVREGMVTTVDVCPLRSILPVCVCVWLADWLLCPCFTDS